MSPDVRRIVAVEAHRRRTGRCPEVVHSLGTGETFAIAPCADGFRDLASGLDARVRGEDIVLSDGEGSVRLRLHEDVGFSGHLVEDHETFTGRAGGGASVTVYDAGEHDFFQYAIDGGR